MVSRFLIFILSLTLLADPTYAAPDLHTVLSNLQRIIAPLTWLVLTVSYVAGIFFIFRAIVLLKKFGMGQTQGGGDLGGPLMYLLVGTVLLFIPSTTNISMNSLFGETASIFSGGGINYAAVGKGQSLVSYGGSSGLASNWADLANTLIIYMQFLGFLSFVKGWFIISKSGAPGAQPGNLSKGITHIIGGIALVNIVGVMNILSNTIWGS